MLKIAIIDDDAAIREVFQELLELLGYEVKTAKNGSDGLLLCADYQPDVVLSDVNMAGMNGYEFLTELKKRYNPTDFPCFIFVSAQVESDDVRKGMELGAHAYLAKPFNHVQLVDLIEKTMKKMGK